MFNCQEAVVSLLDALLFTLKVSMLLGIQVAIGRDVSTVGSSTKCHQQDFPLRIAFPGTSGGDWIHPIGYYAAVSNSLSRTVSLCHEGCFLPRK